MREKENSRMEMLFSCEEVVSTHAGYHNYSSARQAFEHVTFEWHLDSFQRSFDFKMLKFSKIKQQATSLQSRAEHAQCTIFHPVDANSCVMQQSEAFFSSMMGGS